VPAHGTSIVDLHRLRPRAIVISPGPCTPAEAGCSIDAVRIFRDSVPILGVCLGHQTIAAACGGRVIRAVTPMHGRTSLIAHDGVNLFAGIPSPMTACRYHSLVVEPESLPAELIVTARDEAGTIMAIADESRGVHGVQFHPESILTRHGFRLLANFLDLTGLPHLGRFADLIDDDVARQAEPEPPPVPPRPDPGHAVTF
ncbi:MAG: aminodeoxychorismate/anthranilate synthase component II, partial [Planctomycetes bacterium]|nr:aminodeoxychorismate/anthranilate synthase component II [Planctomycetota bacterium]